ncbi:MAG: hypothetical protein JWN04_371 [Myxococcaceae bacterium]|nr:hypothetical protein [Myxococcaceae bacterium]
MAQSFVVEPYLQRASPSSIEVHWETTGSGESSLEWGKTRQLGQRATSATRDSERGAKLHNARLTGLRPDTRYFYRVHTGKLASAVADLRTPPAASAEADVRMVVMSDMQLDRRQPHVFRDLVRDGVMPLVGERARAHGKAPALVLIPGDLVRHGQRYAQWSEEFFGPLRPLSKYVPLYPVAGNHDEDSRHYFRYFALPSDGSPVQRERWWSSDFSNVRVIGLDTNPPYRGPEQLAWLEQVLAAACAAPQIDFVFAALHHPELSELWPNGELAYSGLISRALEQFSQQCEKPSVAFSGHTHAYARGHSRDAPLTLVSVASAGGDLDRQGEHEPHQHPEYVNSQDEYGFVIVDVKAGDAPSFRIQRISRGTPERPRANELRDEVVVRRYNQRPARPELMWPREEQVDPRELYLTSSVFTDPDGDRHGATRWQVTQAESAQCDFARPAIDVWKQHTDEQTRGAALRPNALRLVDLPPNTGFCYRVRVRDSGLSWSEWSAPARFHTLAPPSEQFAEQEAASRPL